MNYLTISSDGVISLHVEVESGSNIRRRTLMIAVCKKKVDIRCKGVEVK
jgi:hypothetical protein